MIDTVYFEESIADHARTLTLFERFPSARKIPCERYGEVFNRKAQNFRLQKQRPALILAQKRGQFLLATPDGYGLGGHRSYYFSHMLNCIFDCRYCFLQGMYRSASYVLFVNYEDFAAAIMDKTRVHANREVWFFAGYDCDSLALEPITRFGAFFLPLFEHLPGAWLELRTKSTQIRALLNMKPVRNCVLAFSLAPARLAKALEHKVPCISRRLDAMVRLQRHGWRVGLRFDPLIYVDDYKSQYTELFKETFSRLKVDDLHSVTLGSFRVPQSYFRHMLRLYPDEKLFAGPLHELDGMVTYRKDLQEAMIAFCATTLRDFIPAERFFPCA